MKGKSSAVRQTYWHLTSELASLADPGRASNLAWFFKTGKGQYGEGDRFLGIPVPLQRKTALRYRALPLKDLARLLASPIHEHRFAALEILVAQYESGDTEEREAIFDWYLQHASRINNWDLVDTSAPYIVGEHLKTRARNLLDQLARSDIVWERRIAIVSTLALIKQGEIEDTFRIAQMLLSDKHDLIHKAVGWALREAGKVARPALLTFLAQHHKSIPRTTLRYAIEHFPPDQRKQILTGNFAQTS
ncbi:MAG: DNA alkylation repair protein [Acidobacteriaceae bacterium]|nr:DNA alkylation repair protein [Acidobacteriaceae bacterium]MBV9766819.1 DNA alkylation repair protein [Acidobacteriaceae bacterium]